MSPLRNTMNYSDAVVKDVIIFQILMTDFIIDANDVIRTLHRPITFNFHLFS